MIFENLTDILDLIKEPKNKYLDRAVIMHNQLNMLVNGVGVENYLNRIDGHENKAQEILRKKVSKSMKHIFSAALRPLDKVFTARGGSEVYNLPEAQQSQMKDIMANSTYDGGVKGWYRNNWLNKFVTDPNGLIFWEVGEDITYPTYKSITTIHDYMVDGVVPEYVIFKSHKEEDGYKYYRVVDDVYDRIVGVNGDNIIEIEDDTYENYFGFIPAMTCSDIPDPNYEIKLSPIDGVVELAMEYLRDMSIHSIYKFLHGYPLFWQYVYDCPHCDGTGKIDGDTCSYCGGAKKKLTKDVSDMLGLEIPGRDDPDITPPAGYIAPGIEVWQEQRTELDWLYNALFFGIWGTHTRDNAENETATGRFIDTQPVNDRLNGVTDTADNLLRISINIVGSFYFTSWQGGIYNLGRRYQIESVDAMLKRYTDARRDGASEALLNYLLMQYYQSQFDQQPKELAKHLKLMQVEPFIHRTIQEVTDMNVPLQDYYAKLYFTQWAEMQPIEKILFTEAVTLQNELINYVKPKQNEQRSKSTEVPGMA